MTQIFGLVRFSYLGAEAEGYRQSRGLPLERRAESLFHPKRLDARFRLFEAICLPSLAAQPADRFHGVILASADMPQNYRDRLTRITAPYAHITPVFEPPKVTRNAFAEAVGRLARGDATKLTFRLDDDDAVARGYSDHVARYCDARYHGHCVTLFRGFGLGRVYGRTRLWRRNRFLVSAGLAFINPGDAPETVYDCRNHTTVADRFPTIADGSVDGFLQSSHGINDSGSHLPLAAWFRPSATMSLARGRDLAAGAFPFLARSEFEFL